MVVQPCLCKQLIREDRMSWIASSLCQDLQGGGVDDLLRKYTSWLRSLISLWEVWYPTSFMADVSAFGSSFGRICQAASVDKPLCLLPSFLSSMQEHIMEDDGSMRPLYLPSGVFV